MIPTFSKKTLCKVVGINGDSNTIGNESNTPSNKLNTLVKSQIRHKIPLRCTKLFKHLVNRRNNIFTKLNSLININDNIQFNDNSVVIKDYKQFNRVNHNSFVIKDFFTKVDNWLAYKYELYYNTTLKFYYITVSKITFKDQCMHCGKNLQSHSRRIIYRRRRGEYVDNYDIDDCYYYKNDSDSFVEQYFIGAIFVKDVIFKKHNKHEKYVICIFDSFVKTVYQNIFNQTEFKKKLQNIVLANIITFEICINNNLCYDLYTYISQFYYTDINQMYDCFFVNLKVHINNILIKSIKKTIIHLINRIKLYDKIKY